MQNMLLTISVVAIAIGVAILGTLVLLRGAKTAMHVSFAIFAYAIAVWTIANFIDTNYKTLSIAPLATYVDFTLGCFLGYAIWFFASTLLAQADTGLTYRWLYGRPIKIAVGVVSGLAALSVYLPSVLTIEQAPGKSLVIEYGPGFVVYSGLLLILAPLIIITTFFARRRAHGRLREQISIILAALVATVILLALADLLLPNLSTSPLVNLISGDLAYLGIAFVVAGTFYSIVKRQLFDMRLAIARTFGFALVIGIVAAGYALLVLLVSVPIFSQGHTRATDILPQLLIFLPPTIIVALTVPLLERLMAVLTSRIFFQHAYDSRVVLDRLSDALISDNDLQPIMRDGLSVLCDALKPAHALFIVLDESGNAYRHQLISRAEPAHIADLILQAQTMKPRILVKDDQPIDAWHTALESEDISVVLRLGTAKNMTGVIMFGPKQDGRMYTRQDIELLGVSAKNFGIAVENAKKYEQIATFADTMHQEVLRATASLRRANTKLKTLDALKDDFISMASHQLRSPASSVHDAIKMLGQSYIKVEERARILELADASSERLVNVVTDMLSVARIQAGHFDLEKTEVDIMDLVERTVLQASALADEKGITIRAEKPKQPIILKADRAKLIEIMSNYLENAIRYSPEHAEILVSVSRTGGRVDFTVRDHGIGVPKEERRHLFDKFYRATNARKEQPNGNGIGLFVVQTVARAHDGDAYYEPQSDGGSLFGFWLKSDK